MQDELRRVSIELGKAQMELVVRKLDNEFSIGMLAKEKERSKNLLALLLRAMAQLDQWYEKYGDHNPEWLPPAGDVRLAEDVSDALVTPNVELTSGPTAKGADHD